MTDYRSNPYQPHTKAGGRFALVMVAIVLVAFAYLTYGPGLDHGYVGIGALFAIPFAIGGLLSGSRILPFEVVGCVLAPIALFAIIFPLVYFGFAEGLVCIAMVMPFWLAAGVGGALAARVISLRHEAQEAEESAAQFKTSILAALPFALILAEEANPPLWQEREVVRSVTIDASSSEVWPLLIAVPDIEASEGTTNFTHSALGIPRPSHATLKETESGLVRKAQWGENIRFEEHITAIDPEKRIHWNFVFPDDSVQSHTDQHIDPNGPVLKIADGGYTIKHAGPGQITLTLTTRYEMRTRLGWYFEQWGEWLLGDVQNNVLAVIKARAENRPGKGA